MNRKEKQKEEEKGGEKKKFAKFTNELTDEQIKELAEISEDYKVLTPDNLLATFFQNIPEII